MKEFPDKFFDLAVVDPPYGINSNGKTAKSKGRLNQGSGKLKNRILNQSDCSWDYTSPSAEYFEELFRVSKDQIIWGGNYFELPPYRCVVVWDKVQPWENFSQVEIAWTSFDCPAKIFKYDSKRVRGKIHPTQKPVQLYSWLFDKFACSGMKILDTHLGSGSSRIAAYDAGLDFWGYEINESYFEKEEERFAEHTKQLTVFSAEDLREYERRTE